MRRSIARLILAAVLSASSSNLTLAAISSQGDVSPAPPTGGGSITSILRVGNNTLGIMEIAGGTPLSQNTDAFVGNNSDAIGYVTLSGVDSNWILTLDSSDMTVGSAGVGTVSLENFARVEVQGDTSVGFGSTGVGAINIDGAGTVWETDNAAIGVSGIGNVNITSGGRLVTLSSTLGTNLASEGRVVIADPLSQWRITGGVTVGSSGRGTISLVDGGLLRTTGASTIANTLSGTGLVDISGAGSVWNSIDGNVTVGSGGVGKLHVFDSGRLAMSGGDLLLASTTGSRGEVWIDGIGSILSTNGSINSGVGESLLTISGGGEAAVGAMSWGATGRLNLQEGRLKVTSQGGFSNSGLVAGSGVIEVSNFVNAQVGLNRGRVQVAVDEHLRTTSTMVNNGLVDLAGGELEVGGALTNNFDIDARNGANLRVGGLGLDNNNGGQLAITAGEVDVFGAVDNNAGAQILVGNGASAVFHDTVTNNGDLVVMSGSTLLAVEQLNLSGIQSNLSLHLTTDDVFAETAPVQAAGQIILGGDLTVTLAGGFQPQAGDVFPLLASEAGLSGVFFNENLPGLGAGLDWEIQRTTNSMSLAVVEVAGAPGDFDNDGDIDGRDFLAWQRDPGVGNLTDWQAGYGAGATAGLSSSVVPEPAAVLLLTAIAGWLVQQRAARCRAV